MLQSVPANEEEQRQKLKRAIDDLARASRVEVSSDDFTTQELDNLWENGYRHQEHLKHARAESLRAAGLRPARVDGILALQGAAAGPGPGSVGAGGAPMPKLLVDEAAKLHRWPEAADGTWELRYNDEMMLYMDAAGVVDSIHKWATAAFKAAADKIRVRSPVPLLVSGLVKTGKSYTQQHVVPAVVAEVLRTQEGAGPLANMVVLRLKADTLAKQEGATVMLRHLLRTLLQWACSEGVPMQAGALQAAEAIVAQPFCREDLSSFGDAIIAFLRAVEVPVLVLCDEVQSLLLPTIGSKLDVSGAEYIRNTFLKTLLLYGPHTMLWCITGSSMATTWVSLASMQPNGYTLITSVYEATLPASYSTRHMQLAWEQLQQRLGPLDDELRGRCPPSVALLTIMVEEWVDKGCPRNVEEFVRTVTMFKLIDESRKEWNLGLEAMPLQQRCMVLDLSFQAVGAKIDMYLHPGLRRLLKPHLDTTAEGRSYLKDAYQRQIVRLLINKDGTLRQSWSELEFSATLTQLDGGWTLLRLGETADYLLSPPARLRWEGKELPVGTEHFRAKLQGTRWRGAEPAGAVGAAALVPGGSAVSLEQRRPSMVQQQQTGVRH